MYLILIPYPRLIHNNKLKMYGPGYGGYPPPGGMMGPGYGMTGGLMHPMATGYNAGY